MKMTDVEKARRYRERKRIERAAMPTVSCWCGCGKAIPAIDSNNRPARYAHGHNPHGEATRFEPGQEAWNKGLKGSGGWPKGKPQSPEATAKRIATRYERYGGKYVSEGKGGHRSDPETWRHNVVAAIHKRAADGLLSGENNPFYGHEHSAEFKARQAIRMTGENHPNWNNGASTFPYGPEFTRRYKRLIRQRDSYICQRCGKTKERNGKALPVHHIDHDKANNDPTNLVTVCNACNVWFSYHRDEPFIRFVPIL